MTDLDLRLLAVTRTGTWAAEKGERSGEGATGKGFKGLASRGARREQSGKLVKLVRIHGRFFLHEVERSATDAAELTQTSPRMRRIGLITARSMTHLWIQ